jgi:hypothetical protein
LHINYIYAKTGDPTNLEALVNMVSLPREMVEVKNVIKQTYDKITGTIASSAKTKA